MPVRGGVPGGIDKCISEICPNELIPIRPIGSIGPIGAISAIYANRSNWFQWPNWCDILMPIGPIGSIGPILRDMYNLCQLGQLVPPAQLVRYVPMN